jgi:hypothetical protein
MGHVLRLVGRVKALDLDGLVGQALGALPAIKAQTTSLNGYDLPAATVMAFVFHRLCGLAELLRAVAAACTRACELTTQRLAKALFMPFNVTSLALMSRVIMCARAMHALVISSYTSFFAAAATWTDTKQALAHYPFLAPPDLPPMHDNAAAAAATAELLLRGQAADSDLADGSLDTSLPMAMAMAAAPDASDDGESDDEAGQTVGKTGTPHPHPPPPPAAGLFLLPEPRTDSSNNEEQLKKKEKEKKKEKKKEQNPGHDKAGTLPDERPLKRKREEDSPERKKRPKPAAPADEIDALFDQLM